MMGTMGRPVQKLFDLEIDEVSSVDRPANQHGLIAFSKSLGQGNTPEEGGMTVIYDETGAQVDESELEHGETVFDDDGNEYVFIADGTPEAEELGLDEGYEDEGVGKAAPQEFYRGIKAGLGGWNDAGPKTAVRTAGRWIGKNPRKAGGAAAGGVGVAGAGAWGVHETQKSLGAAVLEELSKAVTEDQRMDIIAKAMDEVEIAKAEAAQAYDYAERLEDQQITAAFISKAAEYNLPVDPTDLGLILKAAATVLSDEQLDTLDRLFTATGDALYEELGYTGAGSNSGILDQVSGLAAELVGKSAGDITLEQATTAMFEATPGAYETYLAENGR